MTTTTPSRPMPSVAVRSRVFGGQESSWFRGIQFNRQVNSNGECAWRMVSPIRGPVFPTMREAARWCRANQIQDETWVMGMPHKIERGFWDF